jgi:hypothetical protein
MELEVTLLSERSQAQKAKCHMFSLTGEPTPKIKVVTIWS